MYIRANEGTITSNGSKILWHLLRIIFLCFYLSHDSSVSLSNSESWVHGNGASINSVRWSWGICYPTQCSFPLFIFSKCYHFSQENLPGKIVNKILIVFSYQYPFSVARFKFIPFSWSTLSEPYPLHSLYMTAS